MKWQPPPQLSPPVGSGGGGVRRGYHRFSMNYSTYECPFVCAQYVYTILSLYQNIHVWVSMWVYSVAPMHCPLNKSICGKGGRERLPFANCNFSKHTWPHIAMKTVGGGCHFQWIIVHINVHLCVLYGYTIVSVYQDIHVAAMPPCNPHAFVVSKIKSTKK